MERLNVWQFWRDPRPFALAIFLCVIASGGVRVGYGQEDNVGRLIGQLQATEADVRSRAAYELGVIKDPRAVEPLIEALKDSNINVRCYAADALGEIKDRRAAEALRAAEQDSDATVRQKAVEALARVSNPSEVGALSSARSNAATASALTATATLANEQTPKKAMRAAALEERIGTVKQMRFFESGPGSLPTEQRHYSNVFAEGSIRFINWELVLSHPAPHENTRFKIKSVWYGPKGIKETFLLGLVGGRLDEQTSNSYFLRDWKESYHAGGFGGGVHFAPGVYRVELSVEGVKIAEGSFEVYSGPQRGGQQVIPVVLRAPAIGKQAKVYLVLSVNWIFSGNETEFGGQFIPDVDVIDAATGAKTRSGMSTFTKNSGLADNSSSDAQLSFSSIYRTSDNPSRVYFGVGSGDLDLWWSDGEANGYLVELNPAWLAGSSRLPPTPDHPAGGVRISHSTAGSGPWKFFVDLGLGPENPSGGFSPKRMGTE